MKFPKGHVPWNKSHPRFCLICSRIIKTKPSLRAKFCSLKCGGIARKGFKHSEETRKKIALANKKDIPYPNCLICSSIIKSINWKKAKFCSRKCRGIDRRKFKQPEETKKKISESLRGHPFNGGTTGWFKKGQNKGRKLSEETKEKIRQANRGKPHLSKRGEKCHLWKGGITPINQKIRTSLEYKLWRESVFKRDNWTCIWCGVRGGNLQADHIKPFSSFPDLRFAIDNGRTLCRECHRKTDTYGWKINHYETKNCNHHNFVLSGNTKC